MLSTSLALIFVVLGNAIVSFPFVKVKATRLKRQRLNGLSEMFLIKRVVSSSKLGATPSFKRRYIQKKKDESEERLAHV